MSRPDLLPTEYEGKVLDVNPAEVDARILHAGGHRLHARTQRRLVYLGDITPGDRSRWLRLRDDGTHVTIAVKQIESDALDGTREAELAVADFDTAAALLAALGFAPKAYHENHRTSYSLAEARLEIDRWPRIPPYLEIEADSHDDVLRVARLLHYSEEHLTGENTTAVYTRYGIDLATITDLRF